MSVWTFGSLSVLALLAPCREFTPGTSFQEASLGKRDGQECCHTWALVKTFADMHGRNAEDSIYASSIWEDVQKPPLKQVEHCQEHLSGRRSTKPITRNESCALAGAVFAED